ncbi:MAG: DNA-processing protein DprA [Patescibacteria group bacterium]
MRTIVTTPAIRVLQPIPERLRNIPDPPRRLWVRGGLPPAAGVAIVGSRRATAYGRRVATLLAGRLGAAGVPVVSGLAFGIDVTAHAAALDAGGRSIAVLPTGLDDDDVSPRSHRSLARRIASQGALVSEYPAGTESRKHHYEARNRLIAGLARTVVVVEAARPSGTLITARHADDQSKDIWAVPGRIEDEQSLGTNWLLSERDARPFVSVDDFLESYGIASRSRRLSGIAAHLTRSASHFDDLVTRSGRPAAEVEAELTKLELAGAVRHVGDRYYVLA